jgi:hypothetical protein
MGHHLLGLVTLSVLAQTVVVVANASAQTLQVEASRLRSVLAERSPDSRVIEVHLKDGSVDKGKMIATEEQGLRLSVKEGRNPARDRVIPYGQISRIRLDLGPRLGWQITDGIIGVFVVTDVAVLFTLESATTTQRAVALPAMAAGGYLGTKLGGRHRKWLVLEVRRA